jgi:hypothetical protein
MASTQTTAETLASSSPVAVSYPESRGLGQAHRGGMQSRQLDGNGGEVDTDQPGSRAAGDLQSIAAASAGKIDQYVAAAQGQLGNYVRDTIPRQRAARLKLRWQPKGGLLISSGLRETSMAAYHSSK